VDLDIRELTDEQFEEVTDAAESAARKHVFSKITQKLVDRLDISIEAEGTKPVNFTVEVDLELLPEAKSVADKALVADAVAEAFKAIEAYLRKLK
jgi:hypothetical protein